MYITLDPFYMESCSIKWVKTIRTDSTYKESIHHKMLKIIVLREKVGDNLQSKYYFCMSKKS